MFCAAGSGGRRCARLALASLPCCPTGGIQPKTARSVTRRCATASPGMITPSTVSIDSLARSSNTRPSASITCSGRAAKSSHLTSRRIAMHGACVGPPHPAAGVAAKSEPGDTASAGLGQPRRPTSDGRHAAVAADCQRERVKDALDQDQRIAVPAMPDTKHVSAGADRQHHVLHARGAQPAAMHRPQRSGSVAKVYQHRGAITPVWVESQAGGVGQFDWDAAPLHIGLAGRACQGRSSRQALGWRIARLRHAQGVAAKVGP